VSLNDIIILKKNGIIIWLFFIHSHLHDYFFFQTVNIVIFFFWNKNTHILKKRLAYINPIVLNMVYDTDRKIRGPIIIWLYFGPMCQRVTASLSFLETHLRLTSPLLSITLAQFRAIWPHWNRGKLLLWIARTTRSASILISTFWRWGLSIITKASWRPVASASSTLPDPWMSFVAAPTQRPSTLRKTRPNPQWPSSQRWASTLRVKPCLVGGILLMLLHAFEAQIEVELMGSGLRCYWYSWRDLSALSIATKTSVLIFWNTLLFRATYML
jgi:hypothetical protein